jgi:hypothetical protein
MLCFAPWVSQEDDIRLRIQQRISFDLIKRNAVGQNHVRSAMLKTHTLHVPQTTQKTHDAEQALCKKNIDPSSSIQE